MSNLFDLDGGITPPDRIEGVEAIGKDQKKLTTPAPFQSYMQQPSPMAQNTAGIPSPFDLSREGGGRAIAGTPSVDSVLSQVNTANSKMTGLHSDLNTPKLTLNHAQKYLVGNKLADARAHINSAASKLGIEPPPPKDTPSDANPLVKFMNILTDGQNQLNSAKDQLESMKMDGKTMNPGDLLLMQVKLGKANSEIDYASTLVSKAVDATKQLFGIQL
jgi:hypothetical protein